LGAAALLCASSAWGFSTHVDKALGVYNIETYATQHDAFRNTFVPWKSAIATSGNLDAYEAFWNAMTTCTGSECANTSSHRFGDANMTVNNMLGTSGWVAHDMVFFFGHNVAIREWNEEPDWAGSFMSWIPYNTVTGQAQYYYTGSWAQVFHCPSCTYQMDDWGTTVIPYYYHARGTSTNGQGIRDASWTSPAYSVFYGYNPLTSVLVGQDFRSTSWYSENTIAQTTFTTRSGQLGGELEFVIANGCEAVPVARLVNHLPGNTVEISDQGRVAWKPSWRGLHSAMGHYYLTTTGDIPNLVNFANDIKAGVGVGRAYFNAHTCNWSGMPGMCQPGHLAPRDGGVFDSDKWTAQVADPTTTDEAGTWYATYWVGG
jgi:hypothetical protein